MEIKEFLKQFEGVDLEFRAKFKNDEDRDRDIKVISSFFNGRGGTLLFGISEDGTTRTIVGTDMAPQTIENNLTNKIRGKCEPELLPKIVIHSMGDGKHVIEVRCVRGKLPPYKADGIVYIRRNSSTFKATDEEIADLYKQRQPEFDKAVLEKTGIDDLNLERFKSVFEKRDSKQIFDDDLENLLIRNNLAVNEDGFHLTLAGLLLFGKKPQQFLPQAKILVQVTDIDKPNEWKYIGQFEGNIFDQIESVEKFFNENLKKSAKVVGFERKEELEIPIQALREAIINAIVHRDYHDATSDIQMSLTPSELKIINPGGLVAPLTINEIEKGSFIPKTRNPVMAEVLLSRGLMDKRGTGIKRMIRLALDFGLDEPSIREISQGQAFEVSFARNEHGIDLKNAVFLPDTVLKSLSESERKILVVIEREKEIRPAQAEKVIRLSRPKTNEILASMMKKEILKRIAKSKSDPQAKYVLHDKFGLSTPKKEPVDKAQPPLSSSLFEHLK